MKRDVTPLVYAVRALSKKPYTSLELADYLDKSQSWASAVIGRLSRAGLLECVGYEPSKSGPAKPKWRMKSILWKD